MKNKHLPFLLFAGGVALLIISIFWSLYAFGEVGQLVGPKGLRPNNSFICVMGIGENCGLLSAAHAEKGTTPYSPLVFWVGLLAQRSKTKTR